MNRKTWLVLGALLLAFGLSAIADEPAKEEKEKKVKELQIEIVKTRTKLDELEKELTLLTPKSKYRSAQKLFSVGKGEITSVTVSPDGKILAVGTASHKGSTPILYLVEAVSGKTTQLIREYQEAIASLAFSHDSKTLYAGSFDRSIGVWDVATGRELKRLDGHTSAIKALAVSADGKRLVSSTGQEISSDGKHGHEIRIWDMDQGKSIKQIPISQRYETGVTTGAGQMTRERVTGLTQIRISADLSTALITRSVHTYEQSVAVPVYIISLFKDTPRLELVWKSERLVSQCTAAALSPDGKTAITAHNDLKLRYWDVTTAKLLREIQAPRQPIVGLAFSPDGTKVAMEQSDGSIRLLDVKTDAETLRTAPISELQSQKNGFLLFSPDGNKLFTAREGQVYVLKLSP